MAYEVKNTRNQTIATVQDITVDTTTLDLKLIGKNYPNYGIVQNENFVALLENFASETAPSKPIEGQCWYSILQKTLNIYTSTGWKNVGASAANAEEPANPTKGDLWYDDSPETQQLYVYNGTSWELIGPSYNGLQGFSGQQTDTVVDTLTVSHVVVKFFVNNVLVSIFSADAAFTPAPPGITGFATIRPGLNFNSTISDIKLHGTTTNSDLLNNLTSSQFLRSDISGTINGILSINNTEGLNVGPGAIGSLVSIGNNTVLRNNVSGGSLNLRANIAGTSTTILSINGTTGRASVNTDPLAPFDIATKQYVDAQISSTLSGSSFTGGTITSTSINGSTFNTGTISNSTISNSSVDSASITNSNYVGGTITGTVVSGSSVITNSNLNSVVVNNSSLTNSSATNVAISASTVNNAALSNILFTGANNTAPTPIASTNTNQLATTAFVQLQKISPAFSGIPSAPTAAPGANTTQIATTEFVTQAVSSAESGIDVTSKADKATQIIAGTGLSGGGNLSANRTISISNTGVFTGTYGTFFSNISWEVPIITVNAQGQITSASRWTVPASSNAYGTRTVSQSPPFGGVDGDIWLQV
jgi:uncharacterized protein YjbI with pentapeptide repeats